MAGYPVVFKSQKLFLLIISLAFRRSLMRSELYFLEILYFSSACSHPFLESSEVGTCHICYIIIE